MGIDRDALRKLISSSKEPAVLPQQVINNSLHTAYRVVVYRMNVDGIEIDLGGKVGKRTMDYLLSIDPSNADYVDVTKAIANDPKDELFLKILDKLYARLKEKIDFKDPDSSDTNTIKRLYRRGGLVNEYDITGLVGNVTTTLQLEGANSCNISCVDPALSALGIVELKRLYDQNPWLQVSNHGSDDFYANQLPKLKEFKFREFDLVRVYTYSSLTTSLSERVEQIKTNLGTRKRDDLVSLLTEYSMLPSFTGFVQSITNGLSVNSVATVNVQCMGVSRVLAQTSTVVDQALANQVVMRHREALQNTTANQAPISPKVNIFSGKSALDVFSNIINDSLYPELESVEGEHLVGKPSLKNLYARAKGEEDGPLEIANVIPLFPSLVALHYVKEKFSELVYFCDDAVEDEQKVLRKEDAGTAKTSFLADMLDKLRPYMLLLKNNFELFESTYQSPAEVLDTIRTNTYMEIFEDRSGTFRFRFPKYNNQKLDSSLGPDVIGAISINRSDSNNFSIVQTRFMADLIGALRPVVPDVFIDGLSTLRYGFRVSAPVENPNAISKTFAKELGGFIRFYSTLRESRTASVNTIGTPKIDLGQMISFRYGYKTNVDDVKMRYKNAGVSSGSNMSGDYVGYVIGITETIGVDQVYVQNLTLGFVRDAWISPLRKGESLKAYGSPARTLWDGVGNVSSYVMPYIINLFAPGGVNIFSMSSTKPKKPYPIVEYPSSKLFVGSFSAIESSLDLANFYSEHQGDIDKESKKGQLNRKKKELTEKQVLEQDKKEFKANIEQLEANIKDKNEYVAVAYHQSKFFKNVASRIRSDIQNLQANRLVTLQASGRKGIEQKVESILVWAYQSIEQDVLVKNGSIPPKYKSKWYANAGMHISRGIYNPTVESVFYAAQNAFDRGGWGKFNFNSELDALLVALPKDIPLASFSQNIDSGDLFGGGPDPRGEEFKSKWDNYWGKFVDALNFQGDYFKERVIPNYQEKVGGMVGSIDRYTQGIEEIDRRLAQQA